VSKTLGELERKLQELERTLTSIDRGSQDGGDAPPSAPLSTGHDPLGATVIEPSSGSRLVDEAIERAQPPMAPTPPATSGETSWGRSTTAEQPRQPSQVAQPQQRPRAQQPLETRSPNAEELLRFLDVFQLRINARTPLIRLDLVTSREASRLGLELAELEPDAPDRIRLAHKLIQATKTLGVRDPQSLSLLKRWIRAERGGRDARTALEALTSHLRHLATRLDAALT